MTASREIVWSGNDRARRISSSSFCHSWSSFMSSRSNARSATNVPVNTRTSLLRLRFVHRDRVDAHPQSRKFQAEPDRRSSRRFLREEFPVRLVHRREVSRIREEDRRPDDGTEAQVQFFEDRLDVPQALARLPADVAAAHSPDFAPGRSGACPEMKTRPLATTQWEYGPTGFGWFGNSGIPFMIRRRGNAAGPKRVVTPGGPRKGSGIPKTALRGRPGTSRLVDARV